MPGVGVRPRRKTRVIRNAFGQDPNAPKPGVVVIPPFASTAGGIGSGVTLAGLSMPPVREADVFSEIHRDPAAATDPIGGQSISSDDVFAQEVAKSLPRTTLTNLGDPEIAPGFSLGTNPTPGRRSNGRPAATITGPRAAIALADEDPHNPSPRPPKNLFRRVLTMTLIMLLLIGGAWAGVYALVPIRTRLEAVIQYKRDANLIRRNAAIFQSQQFQLLNDEATRNVALHKFQSAHPGADPGFPPAPAATERSMPSGRTIPARASSSCATTEPIRKTTRIASNRSHRPCMRRTPSSSTTPRR